MRRFHLPIFLIPMLGLALTTSCEEPAAIVIEFLEPVDGQSIPLASTASVHLHVRFTAASENHEIEVRLHPEGDPADLIIDYDLHDHDPVIDAGFDVDLSAYPSGTGFHLEAAACVTHDCTEAVEDDIHFTVD